MIVGAEDGKVVSENDGTIEGMEVGDDDGVAVGHWVTAKVGTVEDGVAVGINEKVGNCVVCAVGNCTEKVYTA